MYASGLNTLSSPPIKPSGLQPQLSDSVSRLELAVNVVEGLRDRLLGIGSMPSNSQEKPYVSMVQTPQMIHALIDRLQAASDEINKALF